MESTRHGFRIAASLPLTIEFERCGLDCALLPRQHGPASLDRSEVCFAKRQIEKMTKIA